MADESMDIDDSCYAREVTAVSRAALQTSTQNLSIYTTITSASQHALANHHQPSSLTALSKGQRINHGSRSALPFAEAGSQNKPATPLPRKRSYEHYTHDLPVPVHDLKHRMHPVNGPDSQPISSSSRSTFASKYPTLARVVTQTPEQRRNVQENIAKAASPVRRIGGMWTSLCSYGRNIASSIWSYISPFDTTQSEIVAVETTPSGSKRRAVGADISPSIMTRTLPGSFPIDTDELVPASPSQTQLHTPPESRPSSSHSQGEKHDSPMADQFLPPRKATGGSQQKSSSRAPLMPAPKVAAQMDATRTASSNPAVKSILADSRTMARVPADRAEREARLAAIRKQGLNVTKDTVVRRLPSPRFRTTLGDLQKAQRKTNQERDKELNEFIEMCWEELNELNGISKADLDRVITPSKREGPGRKMHELSAWEVEQMRRARENEERDEYYRAKDERVWRRIYHEEVYKGGREARLREEARVKAEAERLKKEKKAREDALLEETRLEIEKLETEQRLAEQARLSPKQQLIRPLDSEWEKKVEDIMAMKSRDSIVGKTVDGADIHRHDIGSLVPAQGPGGDKSPWLNDEVVNGVISAIVSRKLEQTGYVKGPQNVPAYAFMPSQWYQNVTKKGMKSVQTWTRRKGIQGEKLLKCEKVFIPVNTGAHWMLLIISPTTKTLEFLDSLNQSGGTKDKLIKIGRDWLEMELGKKYVAEEWTEVPSVSAPQQNSDDCGVFTCFNALAAAKGLDFEEVGNGDMGDARRILAAVLLNGGFKGDFEL